MSTTHQRRRSRPAVLATVLSTLCLLGTAAVARAANCAQQGLYESCSYSYTGDEQTFAVPDGVHRLGVLAIGGSGGDSSDGSARGGLGAQVLSTVDVPVGHSTLYVEVGGNGAPGADPLSFTRAPGGFNKGGVGGEGNPSLSVGGGGGGGGESDVRTCSEHGSGICQGDPRLVVAGGGGGGGGGALFPGGSAGISSTGDGRDGAGPDAGAGGTATAGGSGGDAGAAGGGQDGSLVLGGDGGDGSGGGGGGGAGLYGGGGGAGGPFRGTSGGAGSSFGPPGTIFAIAGGPPRIVITYPIDTTPPAISLPSPRDGAIYSQNEVVDAFYSCADPGGSGVTSCAGPVGFGQPIDTSQVGSHTFTVTSTDATGNHSTESATYTVEAPAPPVQAPAPSVQAPAPPVQAPAQSPAGNHTSPAATVGNLVSPVIKGTPRVGRRLTATAGTWSGVGRVSLHYQWERCNSSGRHCSPIAGATRHAYTPTRADRGHRLTVVITAADGAAHVAKATARSVGPITTTRRVARR